MPVYPKTSSSSATAGLGQFLPIAPASKGNPENPKKQRPSAHAMPAGGRLLGEKNNNKNSRRRASSLHRTLARSKLGWNSATAWLMPGTREQRKVHQVAWVMHSPVLLQAGHAHGSRSLGSRKHFIASPPSRSQKTLHQAWDHCGPSPPLATVDQSIFAPTGTHNPRGRPEGLAA